MTKRLVTFGETLLRLTPPAYERFLQSPQFTAVFGGAEANVAVAFSSFGMDAAYVTVLPDNNPIADAAVAELRRFGVDTSRIVRANGRLGTYYLETAANHRPGRVVYDREYSAMALAKPGDIFWDTILDGAEWFHITGITPAISASAADLAMEAMLSARTKGVTVSLDLNYRRNLWNWGKTPQEVMKEMIRISDILIANEEHLRIILGLSQQRDVQELTKHVLNTFENIQGTAVSLRESLNGQHYWSACLNDRKQFLTGRQFDVTHSVDRIGAGDAFTAGLIYGWMNFADRQKALDFAIAASCLKHSIPGDFCRATADEVREMMDNPGTGRIHR
jgi:2-dehydro-3-deoxygluconokinase